MNKLMFGLVLVLICAGLPSSMFASPSSQPTSKPLSSKSPNPTLSPLAEIVGFTQKVEQAVEAYLKGQKPDPQAGVVVSERRGKRMVEKARKHLGDLKSVQLLFFNMEFEYYFLDKGKVVFHQYAAIYPGRKFQGFVFLKGRPAKWKSGDFPFSRYSKTPYLQSVARHTLKWVQSQRCLQLPMFDVSKAHPFLKRLHFHKPLKVLHQQRATYCATVAAQSYDSVVFRVDDGGVLLHNPKTGKLGGFKTSFRLQPNGVLGMTLDRYMPFR